MLICNNCSTVNEDSATRCVHCNMQDNFRAQIGESRSDEMLEAPAVQPCRNCGSHAPGEGSKCSHCHFPLPEKKNRNNAGLNHSELEILRPHFQNTSKS